MRFRPTSLGLDEDDLHDDRALIEVPVTLKRCGMAMRLIVNQEAATRSRKTDMRMITLLTKASDWINRLKSGECKNMAEIAKEDGTTTAYVCKIIPLAFLSPEIVRRIMLGQYPAELNAEQLLKKTPLSHDWAEQAKLLGFTTDAAM